MILQVIVSCGLFSHNADGTANHGNNAVEIAGQLRQLAALIERESDRMKPGTEFGVGPVELTDHGPREITRAAYFGSSSYFGSRT